MRSFLLALVLCAASALALAQPSPVAPDPGSRIPDGFTPIFNGVDLTGWHVSRTNHHGTSPDFRVMHGVIVGTQHPRGKGGILLTDRKYNDQLITEFTDTANHAANGATDGMIAIQMHYSDEKTPRWVDAGFWRWPVIAVKELL